MELWLMSWALTDRLVVHVYTSFIPRPLKHGVCLCVCVCRPKPSHSVVSIICPQLVKNKKNNLKCIKPSFYCTQIYRSYLCCIFIPVVNQAAEICGFLPFTVNNPAACTYMLQAPVWQNALRDWSGFAFKSLPAYHFRIRGNALLTCHTTWKIQQNVLNTRMRAWGGKGER